MTTKITMRGSVESSPDSTLRRQGRGPWPWILVALAALASCTELAPVSGPPTIDSFAAQPPTAAAGETVTLAWSVSDAATIRMLPGGADVTGRTELNVHPQATTTYVLVAENEFGSRSRSVEVRIGVLPSIASFERVGGLVNPGMMASLTWAVHGAESVELRGPGLGAGSDVTGSSGIEIAAVVPGAEYTLVASNAFGAVEANATLSRSIAAVSVLVAGQSNAAGYNLPPLSANAYIQAVDGVMMLGNDYKWKPAYEPLDDCTGHVDLVSGDACATLADGESGVSMGVSLGNRLGATTGRSSFLIPAALGGTTVKAWLPGDNRYDRNTLFGSAAHRGRLAEEQQGAPLGQSYEGVATGAVFWYQGESNTVSTELIADFNAQTPIVLGAFQQELNAPIILAQLGRRGRPTEADRNQLYQIVRETQRRYETGALLPQGDEPAETRPRTYLVVTHDLPMADHNHLSAAGQVELGRRISLAMREHLFGENVDGSGPRLVRIDKESSTVVRVHTDRPIALPQSQGADAYAGYFAVFAGGERLEVDSIVRHPDDDRVVRIQLASPAAAVEVRYMPPPIRLWANEYEVDVIRSATCADPHPVISVCLPMPAFGAATDTATASALSTFSAEDDWPW